MKTPLCALLLAFVATATACVPHPPAHGPVPAPAAVEVDPPRLVASLRRDFPGATVDPSTPRRIVRVRLGEVAAVHDSWSFAKGILERHHEAFAYTALDDTAYFAHRDRPFRRIAITEIGSSRSERSDVSLRLWMIGSRLASRVSGPPC